MQDISGKKTTLDDDAEIYKLGDERSESKSAGQHWRELDRRGRWKYFKTYYLGKTLLALAIIALVGYAVYAAVRPKPKELAFIAVLDGGKLDGHKVEEFFDNAAVTIGYEKGKAKVACDMQLSSSGNNESDLAAISTYIFAKKLDIMFANEEATARYAQQGVMRDLAEVLPADILNALPDEYRYIFHYVPDKTDPEGSLERDIFVGITLDQTSFIQDAKYTTGETGFILSLIRTGEDDLLPDIIRLIRVILGLPQP